MSNCSGLVERVISHVPSSCFVLVLLARSARDLLDLTFAAREWLLCRSWS